MKTIPFSNTSASLSAICLGCLHFGSRDSKDLSYQILDRYYEAGGRFFDTSNNYAFWLDGFEGSESERLLGEWIQDRGARDEITLATKVGAKPRTKGVKTFVDSEGLSASVIEREIDESLSNLQTDRIDLYYAHIDHRESPLEETLGAFNRLVEAGKVRHLGCSNIKPWRIEESRKISEARGWAKYLCVQQRHSYLRPRSVYDEGIQETVTDDLVDYAASHDDFQLITYGPLLWGAYTQLDRSLPEMYDHPETYQRLYRLNKLAGTRGVTPNQLVLAWLLHQKPKVLPIIAVGSLAQLDENLAALEIELSAEDLDYLG